MLNTIWDCPTNDIYVTSPIIIDLFINNYATQPKNPLIIIKPISYKFKIWNYSNGEYN